MLVVDNLWKEETAMGGYMSGSQFGTKAGWRVGIFLALTIGFPFIVYGIVLATGANRIGGAGGAVAVVAGIFLKPLIVVAFVISLLSPCWRRMRSLGFPGLAGLLVPLLFLFDWPYLMIAGTHWGVGFSLGIMSLSVPMFAMTALAMLIAMSAASPPDLSSPSQRMAGWICAGLAIALVLTAIPTSGASLWMMASIWFMSPGGKPALFFLPMKLVYWSVVIKPFICVAFCMAMAALAYMSRRESEHSSGDGDGGPPVRLPSVPSPNSGAVAFGRR